MRERRPVGEAEEGGGARSEAGDGRDAGRNDPAHRNKEDEGEEGEGEDDSEEDAKEWCGWCRRQCKPHWDHLCWHCGAFARGRPRQVPRSLLQRRMGWPASGHRGYDDEVAAHMARVREEVLRRRRGLPPRPPERPLPQPEEGRA